MARSGRWRENHLSMQSELQRLLSLFLYGKCEITQFYLHRKKDKVNINLYIIAVFEEGQFVDEGLKYLMDRPFSVNDEYNLCIHRYSLSLSDADLVFSELSSTRRWRFKSNTDLLLGDIKLLPKQFVPAKEESILSRILKNNYLNGSYVFEFFDESKEAVNFLLDDPTSVSFAKINKEANKYAGIDFSVVRDRIGNVMFQLPIRILNINVNATNSWDGVEIGFTWRDEIRNIPDCFIEVTSTLDGNIMGSTIFEYNKTPYQRIDIGNLDQIDEIKIWLREWRLLIYTFNGSFIRTMSFKAGIINPEPRIFEDNGQIIEVDIVSNEFFGIGQQPRGYKDFVNSRIYDKEREKLEKDLVFKQYGIGRNQNVEALNDIRSLIKLNGKTGIFLWDPFLSADDVITTLYYSDGAGIELRAIGSINDTVKTVYEKKGKSVPDIIKEYHDRFGNPANSNVGLNLEFRIQFSQHGWSFHDRFLCFPGNEELRPKAYSLGTSINSIGKDHHILQEVSYPQRVIDAFNELWIKLDKDECIVWKSR